ncbi:unnamed protein product [Nesidiocoris tenuis]|uniref:Reverse transcriptase domain-containing protein n=1 Tax=Nesidiocoris tenuis TaxID=355587 RepID=A0A6H5G5B3_9HEMI|nr:unnamed protein product [Nesidiocoris tenuis]
MIDHYRPICTLSNIPKMLGRLVLLPMQRALSLFLAAGQHGFLRGRSTVTNLLEFQEYALCGVAGCCQVDLVSTDFAKAFDRLSHHHNMVQDIILAKLDSVGVHGALLAWFSGYLSDRSLVVRIKGALSAPFLTSSGVPQGSHIGPLLFLLVIDSVVEMFKGLPVLLFADDLKVFFRVGSARDCRRIQAALDRLSVWCGQNSLHLNPSKCSIVSFYRSDSFTCFDYHINGIALNRLTSVVDLGILFDSRLSMTDHINRISARAMKTLGFLKRNTRDFQDIPALVTLYRSLVVPTLEYGLVVWSPFYAAHIHQLEHVQHKFLRYVAYKLRIPGENVNYQELMGLCGLRILEARRAWADFAFFSLLVSGALDCPHLVEQVSLLVPQFHTRHNHLFRVEFSPTNSNSSSRS